MVLDGAAIAALGSVPAADLRELLLAFSSDADIPPERMLSDAGPPMIAEVNHGVWIARCDCGADRSTLPAPGCIVWLDDPWGWCVRCGNASSGGRWRAIVVPAEHERAAIEAALARRPDPATRNWWPGETVAELWRQNAEHGIRREA